MISQHAKDVAGTADDPFFMTPMEYHQLRLILSEMDREYSESKDPLVRHRSRLNLLKKWPFLYDGCHIKISKP